MSAPALKALAAAKTAGVTITLDGDGLILEADPLPSDIVALLKTVKPDLLCVLAAREAAKAALNAVAPPDCLPQRWVAAQDGLKRFVADGYGDQAALLGWTSDELYRVPPVWARVRPHRRRPPDRRSSGDRRHRNRDRHRGAFRVAPQVSPDRTGASGMTETANKRITPRGDDLPTHGKCYQ